MYTSPLKLLFKRTLPKMPGYHSLCLALRKNRPINWEWLDRVPIKPGTIVLVHSTAGDFYMSRPERCSIAKKFFWTRGNREPIEDRIVINLFALLAKDADVVLDIGANSGLFSLVSAKANPDAAIIAFDILPEAYHILIDNLILNNLLERVKIHLMGVGETQGVFHAPFNNVSSEMPSSLSLDIQTVGSNQVKVPITSLDNICIPKFLQKKTLIKIDVEGTEVDIFSHGIETLRSIKPDIICEVLPGARRLDAYDQILTDCMYFKYLITDEGLRLCEKIIPDLRFKDWLFTTNKNFKFEFAKLLQ